jgi:hypothetical protein
MRHLSACAQRGPTLPRSKPPFFWSCAITLLLCSLLTLTVAQQVQAASAGPPPRTMTPATMHAIQQALKKQIHVKHTGSRLTPAGKTGLTPLQPQTSSLPAYNNIGISDPTNRDTANFDNAGRSYSAQALLDVGLVPGITITSQNITFLWPSVATGTPDNYQAAGQVIPVSALPGAATVGFLGASTGGSASGAATLTYTDGTTSTFTLGLTDWWNGTAQFSNQQVASFTTINTKYGTKSGTFYLYSAKTTLNTSKILQSVTLPSTVIAGQLHIFAVGVGGPAFNNAGVSDNSNPGGANFDGGSSHNSYSAQSLQSADIVSGQQVDFDGIAYTWPDAASGTADNYQASGQVLPVIPVPNATTIGFLGAATNGPSGGTATLTYAGGVTQTFTLGFNDWWGGTTQYNNQVAATFSVINQTGGQRSGTYYLYFTEISLLAGQTLQSVTLPSTVTTGHLHVFAVGTRSTRNNLGSSNESQPGSGNLDGGHQSYSIQALEAAQIAQGQLVVFNGINFTWPASYGTFADNYQAAGQSIPVSPVPNATTLGFLGCSTNAGSGGVNSGTATITYTDGSTQNFTLSLTDWWNATAQAGNQIVATLNTFNIPGSIHSGTVHLYYTEVALQAGKTIQSVTLPTTVSSGQMHIFAVGTRSAYNNIGISDNSNPAGANFDGGGQSYSAQDFTDPTIAGWNPGDTLTYEGINYIWPAVPAGEGDNYVAQGQTIAVSAPAGATSIGFVGSADHAYPYRWGTGCTVNGCHPIQLPAPPSSSGTATLTYTDGSTATFTLGMTDWLMAGGTYQPYPGDRLFALLPHHNTPQGTVAENSYLFEMETSLNPSKTLQSVTLPSSVDQGRLHIFMIGTRTGENYPNNIGTSDDSDTVFADFNGVGYSYSIQALEAAGLNEGQPFAYNGVTFTWPASYSVIPDNYQAAGQVIPVTPVASATTLAFLGSATNTGSGGGTSSSGTATITYTDGSTQTFTLALTDWWNTAPQAGNQIVATCSYINNSITSGQQTTSGQLTQTVHVYYTDVALQAGKTIQSVTLPTTVSLGQLHVFALSTK